MTGHLRSHLPAPTGGGIAAFGAADWIGLAAAPTFAAMALATGMTDGEETDLICRLMHHGSPLSGMSVMYLLMSAFHSAPWLRLISGREKRQTEN